MRPMCHPLYEYRPTPQAVREKQSRAHRERLGIPDGCRRVCGVDMPEAVADRLAPILWRIAQYPGTLELGREAALQFLERGVWALRPYMRDTPQWTRARIQRRRERIIRQRKAEERVKAQILARLTRMEQAAERRRERELMEEEDRMEYEQASGL